MPLNILLLGLTTPKAKQLSNKINSDFNICFIDLLDVQKEAPITRKGEQQVLLDDFLFSMLDARITNDDAQDGFIISGYPDDPIIMKKLNKVLRAVKKPINQVFHFKTKNAKNPPNEALINYFMSRKLLSEIPVSSSVTQLYTSIKPELTKLSKTSEKIIVKTTKKPDAKVAPKVKASAKATPKASAKTPAKVSNKTNAKASPKTSAKTSTKTNAKASTKSGSKTTAKAIKVDKKPSPKTSPKTGPKTGPKANKKTNKKTSVKVKK